MFGRKKKETHSASYTVEFSKQNSTPPLSAAPDLEIEPEMEETSSIDKLYDHLSEIMEDDDQWTVTESGFDDEGYVNYTVIHKSKPITVNFNSYENENEAIIQIAGEDVENIIGYDLAADLADKIYYIIANAVDLLEEEREVRNNESAQRFLDILGYGEKS